MSNTESQRLVVASLNKVKIAAVEGVVSEYATLAGMPVVGLAIPSAVREQPLSYEEVVTGAKARAERAYIDCIYSFGIENGLTNIPTTDDYMDVCVCCVYDGEQHHMGVSAGVRMPREIARLALEEGLDLNEALAKCQLTDKAHIGSSEGATGLLTRGRIVRTEQCRQAIVTALVSVENATWYRELVH